MAPKYGYHNFCSASHQGWLQNWLFKQGRGPIIRRLVFYSRKNIPLTGFQEVYGFIGKMYRQAPLSWAVFTAVQGSGTKGSKARLKPRKIAISDFSEGFSVLCWESWVSGDPYWTAFALGSFIVGHYHLSILQIVEHTSYLWFVKSNNEYLIRCIGYWLEYLVPTISTR